LVKKSVEPESYFVGKKKPQKSTSDKQKQPATAESKPTTPTITHAVYVFQEFDLIGIEAPLAYADIPKTIELVKQKKRLLSNCSSTKCYSNNYF